ncbi:major capsid family protein [Lactobacillus sp.]|uniref:major capsid family protein n=1 Tax=Lactobacillus sp. TaxID=1591 RepID=UPI0019CA68F3|nr:major capsid family protein [Lactobacillus sp.]MBD5430137.1 DUF2184 domain-containing protein [Lactobacillus sp.]
MPIPDNTTILNKRTLTYLDNKLYTANDVPLIGRSLFGHMQVGAWDEFVKYYVVETTGQAIKYTNRMTNIPTGDENITEHAAYITSSVFATTYSNEELAKAQKSNISLLDYKQKETARAFAEREDKIIFNGESNSNSALNIYGLTSNAEKVGYQSEDMPADLSTIETDKFVNWFNEMLDKITLDGYENMKPTLVLPKRAKHYLKRIYNDYNPDKTLYTMIKDDIADIKFTDALKGKNIGKNKSSMGLLMFTDSTTGQIVDAMAPTRQPVEYSNMVTKIPYLQRLGGVIIRKPNAIMQLNNILPKENDEQ